ncbi:hypothetical protein D3C78_733220 [compost metagenome]
MPPAMPMPSSHHQCCMNSEKPIRIRVGSGSSAWNWANTLEKAGITSRLITASATLMAISTNSG